MIDLNLLGIFIEVARTKNLGLAAKKLAVTTSALSQRIKSLEHQVGKPLFLRKRTGMELNQNGKSLLELCTTMTAGLTQIENWIKAEKGCVGGHLTVGSISTLINHVFPGFLKIFLKKYPEVSVELIEDISAPIENDVLSGRLDLGIIVGKCKKPSLKSLLLTENNTVLMVCSPDYYLAKKKKITREDLKSAKIIWHAERESRTAREICKELGIPYEQGLGSIRLQNMDACRYYALAGLGITFSANLLVHEDLKKKRLVALPGLCLKKPIRLISRNEQYESPTTTAFKTEILKYYQKLDRELAKQTI